MRKRTSNELRCFCARSPLLALYGLNSRGEGYIHVKVYKGARLYGEMIVSKGEVNLHCRECFRWHRVVMRDARQPELLAIVDPTGME